jgi:hypothetical protein
MNLRRFSIALTAILCLNTAVAWANIHAVVVGIDAYENLTPLEGAVNDARDIADVLTERGADVTPLFDHEASRSAIVSALRRAIQSATAGDTVIFSFAGHGGQEPEALVGDEPDGMDEVFFLGAYNSWGEGAGERLRDNDIAALMMEVPTDVAFILIADSCHSGTMTRAPKSTAVFGKSRFDDLGLIEDDPLPPPPNVTHEARASLPSSIVYLAAARDNQRTWELTIDGEQRGALSYSFARALEGRAAAGDGETTLTDLRAFVRTEVGQKTFGRQDADVQFDEHVKSPGQSTAGDAIYRLFNPEAEVLAPAEQVEEELALAAPPEVHHGALDDTSVGSDVKLIWDAPGSALFDRISGDLIARPKNEAALNDAVLAWRAARALSSWVSKRPAEVRLSDGNERYFVGGDISIEVPIPDAAPDFLFVTIVNLSSSGKVQYVFPDEATAADGVDRIGALGSLRFNNIPVIPPVGADNLIAVFSKSPPVALRRALWDINGQVEPLALLEKLSSMAGDPSQFRIGLRTVYTDNGS